MKENKTEIGIVLDCSGSMSILRNTIIEQFNEFIENQTKIPGECNIWLTTFSDTYDMLQKSQPLCEVVKLNESNYQTTGMTALNDAIYVTMTKMGEHFRDMPEEERPSKVMFVIITDGEENASKKVNTKTVSELIEQQKNVYNWEIVFIGTENLNKEKLISSYKINPLNYVSFSCCLEGAIQMCRSLNSRVSAYRGA